MSITKILYKLNISLHIMTFENCSYLKGEKNMFILNLCLKTHFVLFENLKSSVLDSF